jgi:hypothetical protein
MALISINGVSEERFLFEEVDGLRIEAEGLSRWRMLVDGDGVRVRTSAEAISK